MDMRKKDYNSNHTLVTVTVVATVAVITAILSLSYIIYKKYQKLKSLSFGVEHDLYEDDIFDEAETNDVEAVIMDNDDLVDDDDDLLF